MGNASVVERQLTSSSMGTAAEFVWREERRSRRHHAGHLIRRSQSHCSRVLLMLLLMLMLGPVSQGMATSSATWQGVMSMRFATEDWSQKWGVGGEKKGRTISTGGKGGGSKLSTAAIASCHHLTLPIKCSILGIAHLVGDVSGLKTSS